jgi:hypothetical protein
LKQKELAPWAARWHGNNVRPGKASSDSARALIAAAGRGEIDEVSARKLYALGPEVVTLTLLAAAKRIAELSSEVGERLECLAESQAPSATSGVTPSTPSGVIPVSMKSRRPPSGANVRGLLIPAKRMQWSPLRKCSEKGVWAFRRVALFPQESIRTAIPAHDGRDYDKNRNLTRIDEPPAGAPTLQEIS